jgi:hypothetical protein
VKRSEFVADIALRTGLGANDIARVDVPGALNSAIRQFCQRHQAGWDWLHRYVVYTLTADEVEVAFDAIEALVDVNIGAGTLYPLVRVLEVINLRDSSQVSSLTQIHPSDVRKGYHGWAVEGRTLLLAPAPADGEQIGLRVLIGERPLAGDDDEPLAPALYDEAIIQLARAIVYERKQDADLAKLARADATTEVMRAISFSRPTGAAGPLPREL